MAHKPIEHAGYESIACADCTTAGLEMLFYEKDGEDVLNNFLVLDRMSWSVLIGRAG
jgi:hypothetical protein